MRLRRLTLAAAALVALPALGQIQIRTPPGPKELPPTRTPAPTRTQTPTPAPPDQRFTGPRWRA